MAKLHRGRAQFDMTMNFGTKNTPSALEMHTNGGDDADTERPRKNPLYIGADGLTVMHRKILSETIWRVASKRSSPPAWGVLKK